MKARPHVLRAQQKKSFSAFWMLLAKDWYPFEIVTQVSMTKEANVGAIDPDRDAAEQAVAKLRDASFDVTKLSIIGKDHEEESVVGYDTTWERMKY